MGGLVAEGARDRHVFYKTGHLKRVHKDFRSRVLEIRGAAGPASVRVRARRTEGDR